MCGNQKAILVGLDQGAGARAAPPAYHPPRLMPAKKQAGRACPPSKMGIKIMSDLLRWRVGGRRAYPPIFIYIFFNRLICFFYLLIKLFTYFLKQVFIKVFF